MRPPENNKNTVTKSIDHILDQALYTTPSLIFQKMTANIKMLLLTKFFTNIYNSTHDNIKKIQVQHA